MSYPAKKNGFTLIEALITLTVLSFCMLVLTIRPSQQITQQIESRIFFDLLANELNLAQENSIIHQKNVSVRFVALSSHIMFHFMGQTSPYTTLEIPSHWQLKTNFLLTYQSDGRISNFITVYFMQEDGRTVALVFQLGSGKYEIQF